MLQEREITVTAGMKLAHAPWNNSALNALTVMCQRLEISSAAISAVYGNGSLGYRQGLRYWRAEPVVTFVNLSRVTAVQNHE